MRWCKKYAHGQHRNKYATNDRFLPLYHIKIFDREAPKQAPRIGPNDQCNPGFQSWPPDSEAARQGRGPSHKTNNRPHQRNGGSNQQTPHIKEAIYPKINRIRHGHEDCKGEHGPKEASAPALIKVISMQQAQHQDKSENKCNCVYKCNNEFYCIVQTTTNRCVCD